MYCPNCKQKAMNFFKFILLHPFKEFECDFCGAILKTGLMIRIFVIVTFVIVLASFFYTFPRMDKVIHSYSHSHKTSKVILQMFLPYIIIPIQVVILFIPVTVYAWIWGKLEIVTIKNREA